MVEDCWFVGSLDSRQTHLLVKYDVNYVPQPAAVSHPTCNSILMPTRDIFSQQV